MSSAQIPATSEAPGADSGPPSPLALRIGARIEDGIVILTLLVMMLLPLVHRLLLETPLLGIEGAAAIVQHGTLVVGMIGGAIAARRNRLLSLATTSMLPPGRLQAGARIFGASVAAAVSCFLTLASIEFLRGEIEFPRVLAYGVPAWVPVLAMPLGLGLITLRILYHAADRWIGRGIALGIAALLVSLGVWVLTPSTTLVTIAMGLLILATAAGAPIFAALGGAAVILTWGEGSPLASIPISTHALVTNPNLPTIPLFTLAGYLLAEGGATRRLVRVCNALFGSFRGGPAFVTVIACTFFTSFTGASGVTILALGALLMPVLVAARYTERGAVGLVTGSSAVGMLFPPSLPVIIYAIIVQQALQNDPLLSLEGAVSIKSMFLAALVPGLVLLGLTAVTGIWMGPRRGEVARSPFVPAEAVAALWEAKWELLTPVVALVSVFWFPDIVDAAAVTALYCLIAQAIIWRDLRLFRDVPRVVVECGLIIGGVLLILGVAQGLTNYLVFAMIPQSAVEWVTATVKSPIVFLLLLNVLLLIVGCLMDVYSAMVVIVPILIPIAASYQIDPLHLGVIFLVNLELGFLTPPVGMNLFLASYRFNTPVMRVARAVLPMLIVRVFGVLLITYIPPLTTTLPHWLESRAAPPTTDVIALPPR